MKVYRYLSEEELKFIQSGEVDKIGSFYVNDENFKRINTHKYKKGVKYLHFFFKKEDIKRVQNLDFRKMSNYYICEFNIPFLALLPYIGKGHYDSRGYKTDLDSVYEIAMPATKMKQKYLKSYEIDERHNGSEIKELIESLRKFQPSPQLYDFSIEKEYFASISKEKRTIKTNTANIDDFILNVLQEEPEPGQE